MSDLWSLAITGPLQLHFHVLYMLRGAVKGWGPCSGALSCVGEDGGKWQLSLSHLNPAFQEISSVA